jgi:hypothetical protein
MLKLLRFDACNWSSKLGKHCHNRPAAAACCATATPAQRRSFIWLVDSQLTCRIAPVTESASGLGSPLDGGQHTGIKTYVLPDSDNLVPCLPGSTQN